MFMNFYNEIDKDQSLTFELPEAKSCFEKYANDERLLGKKQIQKIIEHIGVKVNNDLFSFVMEGKTNQAFSDEVYEDIMSILQKDLKEYVQFFVIKAIY